MTARAFLLALFPEWPPDTSAEVRAFEPNKKGAPPKCREWVRSATALLDVAGKLSPTLECYFGVNLRRGRNGTKEGVAYVGALHVDLDMPAEDGLAIVGGFPLPPSAIVKSGGGLHLYWLLREPYVIESPEDVARLEAVNRGLASALGGDMGAWDISRVLRVPGTVSHKRGAAVELVELHPARRFDPGDFEDLGLSLAVQSEAVPVAFAEDADAEAALHKARPLTSEARRLIAEGHPDGANRSSGDFRVCCDLARAGLSDDEVRAIFRHYPVGAKYAEAANRDRYLGLTLGKARAAVEAEAKAQDTKEAAKPDADAPALPFHTGEDIGREVPAEVAWVAKPWVAGGSLTELTARVKGGKTTWITHLCRCVLDGTPFMGEPTMKGAVVYLTEQPKASFRKALERAGLLRPDFHALYKREVVGVPWPDVVKGAVAKAREVGAVLLVTDTLAKFANLPGDMENEAGAALEAIEPLEQASAEGLGVFILRHERKSGGEVGMSGRGSSAFGGAVDTVLRLRRGEGNSRPTVRVIDGLSRFDEVPDSLVVDLVSAPLPLGVGVADATPSQYVALGSEGAVAFGDAKAAILAVLPTSEAEAMPTKEVLAELPDEVRRTTATGALKELREKGEINHSRGNKRTDPYVYWEREGN